MIATTEKKPVEIAREALTLLMSRKLLPTPVNYQSAYCEVAGTPNSPPFPEVALGRIAQGLPAANSEQKAKRVAFVRAISQHNWEDVRRTLVAYVNAGASNPAAAKAVPDRQPRPHSTSLPMVEILEQLARLIESTLPALGTDDSRLSGQITQLLDVLRTPSADFATVKSLLGNVSHRLSFAAEDQAEIRTTLLKLLHLIIGNIGELNVDDQWLKPKIDVLMAAATPPLTLRRLDDLERRLKDVMFKQIEARSRSLEAQGLMRQMLAKFVERLAQMTDSTSAYHDRMEASARCIGQATSITEIAPMLQEVIGATREMALDMKHVRDELQSMREKVDVAEAALVKLQQELSAANTEARHDALTGALNRKGLDEAMDREIADVQRKDTPLCIALLDVDNFKKLNDSKGHETGDAALMHLVGVTRDSLRTQDALACYGGEEFVVLMPDTTLDEGMEAMVRLQRALTKRFFLAGADKILITFSAGVAQLTADESGTEAIARADQAMYLAKRAGKNRVLGS